METELMTMPETPLANTQSGPSIALIIQQAIQAGRSLEELKGYLDFAKEMQARQAEADFNEAFARFKSECPGIVRKTIDANPNMMRVTQNGTRVPRRYASIDDIASVVDGPLTKHRLSYDWSACTVSEIGLLTRTFTLRHAGGHSRSTASPPIPIEGTQAYRLMTDRKAGGASPAQCYGVADTYAMRYSMIAGLGLTTCDEDDDGAQGGGGGGETITDEQARTLNDALIELGPAANLKGLLAIFGVEALAELAPNQFEPAMRMLEAKRKAAK